MCQRHPWYAIRTVGRQELKAQKFIENRLEIETFFPQIKTRHQNLFQALFPSYLFARSPLNISTELKRAYGIIGPVSFGATPAELEDCVIDALRQDADERGFLKIPEFKPGQTVLITSGPFAEWRGIYERQSGAERVAILLNFLGGQRLVQINREDVRSA